MIERLGLQFLVEFNQFANRPPDVSETQTQPQTPALGWILQYFPKLGEI